MSGNDINTNTNVGQPGPVSSALEGSFAGASITQPVTEEQAKSWFEAMAKAWGKAMDQQADVITNLSSQVSDGVGTGTNGTGGSGSDQPSTIVKLQAESLRFGFLSQSEATSVNAVGQGQQSMARKQ